MQISRERHHLMLDGILLFFWYTAIVALTAILIRFDVMVNAEAIKNIQEGIVPKDYYSVFPLILVTGFGFWHLRRFLHESSSNGLTFRMTLINMVIIAGVSIVVFDPHFFSKRLAEMILQVAQPMWGAMFIPESYAIRPLPSAYLYYSFDNPNFAGAIQHMMLLLYAARRICSPFVVIALCFYLFSWLERFSLLREFPSNIKGYFASLNQRYDELASMYQEEEVNNED